MSVDLARGESVPWLVRELLATNPVVSTGEIVQLTGLTRQAVHYHLKQLVEAGELEPLGGGRGRRYRRQLLWQKEYPTEGLMEDRVWDEMRSSVDEMSLLNRDAESIALYGVTEMLNNAIDHSRSPSVRLSVGFPRPHFVFNIEDQGIGAFEHVRKSKGLEDEIAAIQEISKGKMTTDPERHTGEGIFFTSKAVDLFIIASNGWRWLVDNRRNDMAVGPGAVHKGTHVRLEIHPSTKRVLQDLFSEYVNPDTYAFSKTRTVVRLFDYQVPFVSRSEAKRLARNLDQFEEVVIDFEGVNQVGQGFTDELFRVWQRRHPSTELIPTNMNQAVQLMVRRALSPTETKSDSSPR
ncbi:MAG: DUF4325 domain-containing protein [Actinomycetota bacterium]|nr:DUF4325 domain-containing protein [Actinomycetota bacterium]